MGCFWSSESVSEPPKRNINSRSRSTGDLLYIESNVTVQQIHTAHRRAQSVPKPSLRLATQGKPLPVFGEFKCPSCGRTWNSRLCWPNSYQICSRCKKSVYPYNQRKLLPSDMGASKDCKEHKKELCQMCQQLGYYCGNFGNNLKIKRKL